MDLSNNCPVKLDILRTNIFVDKMESDDIDQTFMQRSQNQNGPIQPALKLSRVASIGVAVLNVWDSRIKLDEKNNMAVKIKEGYGYTVDHHTYLHPEEALYLLEAGSLNLVMNNVSLSVERARALLLASSSQTPNSSKACILKTCPVAHYLVYKHLAQLGYVVRCRSSSCNVSVKIPGNEDCNKNHSQVVSENNNVDTKDMVDMDLTEEPGPSAQTQNINSSPMNIGELSTANRGKKRKHMEIGSESSDSDISCEETPSRKNDYTVIDAEETREFKESSVFIEELLERELMASSSAVNDVRASEYLVTYPEDDESHNVNNIWTKLVPNAFVQLGFPSAHLLPENVPRRDEFFDFDLLSTELSKINNDCEVQNCEVTRNDVDNCNSPNHLSQSPKSWTEWRAAVKTEATKVLQKSLIGESDCNEAMEKLSLWDFSKNLTSGTNSLNMPYEVYPPSTNIATDHGKLQPLFLLAVVRQEETIPDLSALDSKVNGVPIIVAVVTDDSTVLFLSPDNTPVPNLF